MWWLWSHCPSLDLGTDHEHHDYLWIEGYLFYKNRLCIPLTPLRDWLTWECHSGGLAGNFGCDKTITMIQHSFNWPSLKRNVLNIVAQCRVCASAKQVWKNSSLYTPLLVSTRPWDDVSMDFVLGLSPTVDNMLFIHEFTWLLMQLKALIIPNVCMLSYFKYISIILYHFILWSKITSIYGLLFIIKTLWCLILIIFKIIIMFWGWKYKRKDLY